MALRKRKSEQKNHNLYSKDLENSMELMQEFHLFNENIKKEKVFDSLEECIEALTKEQNICIKSFYLEKMTYKGISQSFEMEMMKVKSYIQNGKRNLKNCIENKLESK